MDQRKRRVLNAIIEDYIANAEPVGSRAVAKKYGLGVSPATIRNEMSDLEEEGYIEQPHTSAGRIPSSKGYRFYVDHMMERQQQLSEEQRAQIRQLMASKLSEIDEFMRSCCNLVAQMTDYPALISVPEQGNGYLERVQLIRINERQLLVILLASSGIICHKALDLPFSLTEEQVLRMGAELDSRLRGMDIKHLSYTYLKEQLSLLNMREKLLRQTLDLLEQTLTPQAEQKVIVGGMMRLLSQPEFQDIEKLKQFFNLMEAEGKVKELLEQGSDGLLQVTIGTEMPEVAMQDYSMVVANYFVGEQKAGTIGVIGPTRMNYSQTISVLSAVAEALSQMIDKKVNP